MGALAPRLLGDADTGWHIRNGELILATHSITRVDPFSSTMQGKAWYAWEWLYDVGIAAIHHWGGLNGVVFVSALIIALTFALTFRFALARGGTMAGTLLLSVLAMGGAAIHFLARPHLLSWLFTVIWFHLLDSSPTSPRKLFWLPAMMLLWVNLHGGFVLGFVLLGIYLLPNLIYLVRTRGSAERGPIVKRCNLLAMVTMLSALATLVNPYGYRLHLHIYQYLSNRFLMDHIHEFQSPNFHGMAEQCFLLLCLIAVAAMAAWRIQVTLADLLVVLLAIASGLYASRNLPTSSILIALILAPLVANRSKENRDAEGKNAPKNDSPISKLHSFALRMGALENHMRGHLSPALTILIGLWVCSHGGRIGATQVMAASFSEKKFPVRAVDFIQTNHIEGPIFAPDDWGGYLIYRLYPAAAVVTDDRHDLYGEQFFKDYLKLVRVERGGELVLQNNHIPWVLVPSESPLAAALEQRRDWSSRYRDNAAELFEKQ